MFRVTQRDGMPASPIMTLLFQLASKCYRVFADTMGAQNSCAGASGTVRIRMIVSCSWNTRSGHLQAGLLVHSCRCSNVDQHRQSTIDLTVAQADLTKEFLYPDSREVHLCVPEPSVT